MVNKKQGKIISAFVLLAMFVSGLFLKLDLGTKFNFSKNEKNISKLTTQESTSSLDVCDEVNTESDEAYLYAGCGGFF